MSKCPAFQHRYWSIIDDAGVWYPTLAKTKWEARAQAKARVNLSRQIAFKPRLVRVLVTEIAP